MPLPNRPRDVRGLFVMARFFLLTDRLGPAILRIARGRDGWRCAPASSACGLGSNPVFSSIVPLFDKNEKPRTRRGFSFLAEREGWTARLRRLPCGCESGCARSHRARRCAARFEPGFSSVVPLFGKNEKPRTRRGFSFLAEREGWTARLRRLPCGCESGCARSHRARRCAARFEPGFSSVVPLFGKNEKPRTRRGFSFLAEREGFEPSVRVKPYTHFPGEPVRPLRHLSETASNCLATRSMGAPSSRRSSTDREREGWLKLRFSELGPEGPRFEPSVQDYRSFPFPGEPRIIAAGMPAVIPAPSVDRTRVGSMCRTGLRQCCGFRFPAAGLQLRQVRARCGLESGLRVLVHHQCKVRCSRATPSRGSRRRRPRTGRKPGRRP